MTTKAKAPAAQGENLSVTIGGMEIEFSELTARELRTLTPMCPTDQEGRFSDPAMSQIMAIGSIRRIDGNVVMPAAGGLPYAAVEQRFTARNVISMTEAYNRAFPMESGEQLKKASPSADTTT